VIGARKDDHLRICLEQDVQSGTTGFEAYTLESTALPECDLHEIDLSTTFLGQALKAPLLISSMTGGSSWGATLNMRLAHAAHTHGIAMGVGSQRIALECAKLEDTFKIARKIAPHSVLFANLGAVQLNYGRGIEDCLHCVDMIEAQALILHFNALQEALQPEGNTNFKGLLKKLETLCGKLSAPVIAKEVGSGFSAKDARRLVDAGVAAIDVAGAGGTSWSIVEGYRSSPIAVGTVFRTWGIPTARSLALVHAEAPDMPLIASGGIRSGKDIAKSLALGASLAGIALPFLQAAAVSDEALEQYLESLLKNLKIVMFCIGAQSISDLAQITCSRNDFLYIK
jgi:isopentenyl-diphosphate delta-isomerase